MDFAVLDFIRDNLSCGFMDILMKTATALVDNGLIWILTAFILICIPQTRRHAPAYFAALAVTFLLANYGIKLLVSRDRPFILNPDIIPIIVPPDGFSFPSSHTAVSFACATVLVSVKRVIGIGALVFAALVGLSRMYLYVHFPSDVLAGTILGILLGLLAVRVCNLIARRREEAKKAADVSADE